MTTESNKLIAEFMGDNHTVLSGDEMISLSEWRNARTLQFHKSWDWLMPAVQKAANIPEDGYVFARSLDGGLFMDIQSVYSAVVEFIKWYNENSDNK